MPNPFQPKQKKFKRNPIFMIWFRQSEVWCGLFRPLIFSISWFLYTKDTISLPKEIFNQGNSRVISNNQRHVTLTMAFLLKQLIGGFNFFNALSLIYLAPFLSLYRNTLSLPKLYPYPFCHPSLYTTHTFLNLSSYALSITNLSLYIHTHSLIYMTYLFSHILFNKLTLS